MANLRSSNSGHNSSRLRGDPPTAATEQAIVDRRELAFIAIERTHMPMVITDTRQLDTPIVMVNKAFLDLTGYAAAEVIGRNCRLLQGPETCQIAIAEVRAAIAEGREATVELLNYRKDRSTFWNELHLSPIRNDAGQMVYFFGSQRDVSERRAAHFLAASEHRLLREVDHRAMNVLALVDGIVRLSKADTAAGYAAAVQRRVQSLAKAHTLLSSHGWQAVPLEELIRIQLEPFGLSRVDLAGPNVTLAATLVQPLALVVHELIANAAEHGALSTPEGSLTIRWWSRADPMGVAVTWNETGGPPPALERVRGFGSTMISGIVERQLAGTLQRRWDGDGLKAEMCFPLDRSQGEPQRAAPN